jgi:uncharacterized protein YbaR (Trm112 family)
VAERAVSEITLESAANKITQQEMDTFIAEMVHVGESQRRHLRGFSRAILHKLTNNGHRYAHVPTPTELVKLKLSYKGKRKFSALGFLAKFLFSSHHWGDEELVQFAELMGRARGKSVARYLLPPLDGEIKGQAFRQIRRILGWKSSGAALVLGITYAELQTIETRNNPFPHIARPALANVLQLARRLPAEPPPWIQNWDRFSKPSATMPFSIPPCPGCGSNLAVEGKQESRFRGLYWYLGCCGCSGKYWSADGNIELANIGRGWMRKIVDRPMCPHCRVQCVVIGSPGSSMSQRYFACQKCKRHYRIKNGKPVLTTPFLGPRVELSFLPDRSCPNCKRGRLRIKFRPPSRTYYLFNCRGDGSCRRSFRWNEKLQKLVLLKARKPRKGRGSRRGRPSGRGPELDRRVNLAAAFARLGWSQNAMSRFVYPDTPNSAYANTRNLMADHRAEIEEKKKAMTANEAERLFRAAGVEIDTTRSENLV